MLVHIAAAPATQLEHSVAPSIYPPAKHLASHHLPLVMMMLLMIIIAVVIMMNMIPLGGMGFC